MILVLIFTGILLAARGSSTANMLSRDLSDGATRLNNLVDSIRGSNPDLLPKNTPQTMITGSDTTEWIVYNNASPLPYTQPQGLLLFTARHKWVKHGRVHSVESSTLLDQP